MENEVFSIDSDGAEFEAVKEIVGILEELVENDKESYNTTQKLCYLCRDHARCLQLGNC